MRSKATRTVRRTAATPRRPPNLWSYTRELYQIPRVAETVNMRHINGHYCGSHRHIDPTGIVPKGPALDFGAPQDRARLAAA